MTTITPPHTDTSGDQDRDRAYEMAAGLRGLADMLTEHPHLAAELRYRLSRILVALIDGRDKNREQMVRFTRAAQMSGATVTEHDNGTSAGIDVKFGPIGLHLYANVEEVHDVTRVVEYTPRSILTEAATAPAQQGPGDKR